MSKEEKAILEFETVLGELSNTVEVTEDLRDACRVAIEVLQREPCSDVISRQAVLEKQYRIDDSITLSTRDVVNVEDIEDLSPVTPQPKIGHWIPQPSNKEQDERDFI